MSDIFTLDENNNAAVRTVGVKAGAAESNQPDIFTTDENGNAAVRVVGSGGGDSHNLGYFDTLQDLQTAYPTGKAGDWAIVAESDTVYIWDEKQQAWVDTDRKGQVTSVNNKTGDVVLTPSDIGATSMSVPTAPTLAVADWSSNTQTVTVNGVTASNTVIVSPAPASAVEYAACGILCTTQGTDSLTFTCIAVPANALTVNVVILN